MEITTLENGYISISFEMSRGIYVYRDAIVVPPWQYETMTPEEIESTKTERFENWIQFVTFVPVEK